MEPTPDELAGVVDLVGGLTRAELGRACAELAFKRGERAEQSAFEDAIDDAVASYHLVAVPDHGAAPDASLLVPGPTAFPELPEGADDIPHILGLEWRSVSRETVVEAVEERFREDTVLAITADDPERLDALLDVSYDLEAWGPVDIGNARERLDSG